MEVWAHVFLTSAPDLGKRLASDTDSLIPVERPPLPHSNCCTGGWVGPKAGLDCTEKGEIDFPCRESNPDS
jgi:hypothetical protein